MFYIYLYMEDKKILMILIWFVKIVKLMKLLWFIVNKDINCILLIKCNKYLIFIN